MQWPGFLAPEVGRLMPARSSRRSSKAGLVTAVELLLRPTPRCYGPRESDGVHPEQDRLLDLCGVCSVLEGTADMAAQGRLQAGSDADPDLDQGHGLCVQRAGGFDGRGDALVGAAEFGVLAYKRLVRTGDAIGLLRCRLGLAGRVHGGLPPKPGPADGTFAGSATVSATEQRIL